MSGLADMPIHTRLKLSALWTSTMFCYIYCDYFELYTPGKLESMTQGRMLPLGNATQSVLMGTSALMEIPSLMIFLSIALPARLSRVTNISFGILFTLLMGMLTYTTDWYFYKFFAGIETMLTALVVWYAYKWPNIQMGSGDRAARKPAHEWFTRATAQYGDK